MNHTHRNTTVDSKNNNNNTTVARQSWYWCSWWLVMFVETEREYYCISITFPNEYMDISTPLILSKVLGTVQVEATPNSRCHGQNYTWSYRSADNPILEYTDFPPSYCRSGSIQVLTFPVSMFENGLYEFRVSGQMPFFHWIEYL